MIRSNLRGFSLTLAFIVIASMLIGYLSTYSVGDVNLPTLPEGDVAYDDANLPMFLPSGDLLMPSHTDLGSDINTAATLQELKTGHADSRHGDQADKARTCSQDPTRWVFINPDTGRTAYICKIGELFGIHIIDNLQREVTAFIKNKVTDFNIVIEQMRAVGFTLLP